MSFIEKLKNGLKKTREGFIGKIETILASGGLNESSVEELEEILITSDVGVHATKTIIDSLREKIKKGEIKNTESVKDLLKKEMASILGPSTFVTPSNEKPFIILTVGVNGVGKTTTIGKLAARFKSQGNTVMLAASDTFRAAAIEQLELWAEKTGSLIVKHQSGSDPAAVAYDAIQSAIHKNIDIVIIDTAGRLHTKSPLMYELKKIKRVIEKAKPGAPHEALLVIDAATGQNALRQAELFNKEIGLTGIALAKLDGTAKGGIIFAIKKDLNIPVKLIGIGEAVDDLRDFDSEEFIDALFS
jgi:fused signal recognition particle receptor